MDGREGEREMITLPSLPPPVAAPGSRRRQPPRALPIRQRESTQARAKKPPPSVLHYLRDTRR